ncbi:glycosyltransferase family 9 protein [Nitrolancea hollandica]|uniref:Glycosyl transferase family 9 n=1 Tax=Nitrolancea hollandica Lb TaxID=1129897 RepID=I4EI28_9BACT|nr:glycosyltransferase family 9 protein [Nitrolancea hollandica]CCF84340.1 Glycosyl transferase family 9 [Nitrolancea hollandica Lb]
MIDERWSASRRILAVRLDNLGDVLVTTPAIHAVKAALPGVELTLLASPVGAQTGRLNPDIDSVIVYQAPWMDPWQRLPQDCDREQRMIATLHDRRFDGAIIFTSFRQSPLPAAYLCYLAGIPLRLAASIDGPGSLLTTRHKHPDRMMHEVERGLDLIGAIGFPAAELDLVLRVPDGDRDRIRELLHARGIDRDRPMVVIHPGCSMPARTYPWERYAEVGDLLVERLGATVVLSGTGDERALVDQVYARLRPGSRRETHRLAGTLPFATFCALIETADLLITNNTGPMHIAAALKTPVVTLFALTNPPEQWGPWRVPHRQLYHEVPCRLCYSRVCPYGHECLSLITPEMVTDAAKELLAATGAGLTATAGWDGAGR